MRLRIYSWFMKYCHPKLASAGVIAGDVGRRQHPGRRSFHTGWSVQIVYPIRFVTETLLRSFESTFGSAVDLRSPSWTFGVFRGPSADGVTFGHVLRPSVQRVTSVLQRPSGQRVTFILKRPSGPSVTRTFGSRCVAWGNLRYPRR